MKDNRDRKNGSIKERIIELLSKSGPMTSKEISDRLEAYYKSVAMICYSLRKNGSISCMTYKGDMPAYSATQIKKQAQEESDKGITKDDLDYQAYYLLPRHIRRKMPPPVIDSVGAAEMQSFRFAFGHDYAVKTNWNGPW